MLEKSVFNDLSPGCQKKLLSLAIKRSIKAGDYIIKEGDRAEFFYILLDGRAIVSKDASCFDDEFFDLSFQSSIVSIKEFEVGRVLGESSFFEDKNYTQSLVANVDCLVAQISYSDINALERSDFKLLLQVIRRLGLHVTCRLRRSNNLLSSSIKDALINAYQKDFYQSFLLFVMTTMVACFFFDNFLQSLYAYGGFTKVLVGSVQILILPILALSIPKNQPPFSAYGLTLHGWRRSLCYSIIPTISLCMLVVITKVILLHFNFLDFKYIFSFFESGYSFTNKIMFILIYVTFCIPQELIARGILQTCFEKILGSDFLWLAILLSNFLFMVFHVSMMGYLLSILVFGVGLIWGWIYSKQRTLVGVIFSHVIVGVFALNIVRFY